MKGNEQKFVSAMKAHDWHYGTAGNSEEAFERGALEFRKLRHMASAIPLRRLQKLWAEHHPNIKDRRFAWPEPPWGWGIPDPSLFKYKSRTGRRK